MWSSDETKHARTNRITAAVCNWTYDNISSAWDARLWFCSHDCHNRLMRYMPINVATISGVYSCLHRTYRRCWILLARYKFRYFRSSSSCWMMTLSRWLHWHWLSMLSAEIAVTAAASLSWLCRYIWWLNVSWSYLTQWCHYLKHWTSLTSFRKGFELIERLIIWLLGWLQALCREYDICITAQAQNKFM